MLYNVSNASILDENMADITDWTEQSLNGGVVSQATLHSQSCMRLKSSGVAGTNREARAWRDVGAFATRTVLSIRVWHDAMGTYASGDNFFIAINDGVGYVRISFGTDGLFLHQGLTPSEVGVDLVQLLAWQEWTFDINWVTRKLDVYLGQVLQASGVPCTWDVGGSNGLVDMSQSGQANPNQVTYVDWVKVGDTFLTTESKTTQSDAVISLVTSKTIQADAFTRLGRGLFPILYQRHT